MEISFGPTVFSMLQDLCEQTAVLGEVGLLNFWQGLASGYMGKSSKCGQLTPVDLISPNLATLGASNNYHGNGEQKCWYTNFTSGHSSLVNVLPECGRLVAVHVRVRKLLVKITCSFSASLALISTVFFGTPCFPSASAYVTSLML